jgi:hypothetical protein
MTTSQRVQKPVGRPTPPDITSIAVPGWRLTFIAGFAPLVAWLLALLPHLLHRWSPARAFDVVVSRRLRFGVLSRSRKDEAAPAPVVRLA